MPALSLKADLLAPMVIATVIANHSSAFTATCPTKSFYHHHRQVSSSPSTTIVLFESGKGGGLSRSYNDNALFEFHQRTQEEKISGYEASSTYWNTDELWNLEWHDSFVRNGLSDFVPPLTDNLQVLTLGDDISSRDGNDNDLMDDLNGAATAAEDRSTTSKAALDEASSSASSIDEIQSIGASSTGTPKISEASSSTPENQNILSILGSMFGMIPKQDEPQSSAIEVLGYDCILDKGLMSQLLVLPNEQSQEQCTQLLYEGTKRLREMGVYIYQGRRLDDETKEYLTNIGNSLGLQWEFDLDGISDDNVSVSVARKYGTIKKDEPQIAKILELEGAREWKL